MEVNALPSAPLVQRRATEPDEALVAAARAEPREFLALYDRYFDRVLGYVRLRIREEATCEDVTSVVFTKALEHLGRFRGQGSFAGWLFQIARNAVRDVQRQREAEPLVDDRPANGPSPVESALQRERARELHDVIRQLRSEQQHLLALRYGAGLGYDEIGVALGITPATVRVRAHRILEELRRRYPHDTD